MIRKLYNVFIIAFLLFYASCGQDSKNGSGELNVPDSVLQTNNNREFSDGQMSEIIETFSSPIEMAALIEATGVPFTKEFLMPTNNPDYYDTNFKRALGLGMLGVDLGYLNIYNQTGPVVNYITLITKLADGMKVGQFFDFATLKRLASNKENVDSLMYISVNSFNQMDQYLRENQRNNLSTLVVAGVWMEGLYLAGQVVKESPNEAISERIGEQKIVLGKIILLLRHYKSDPNIKSLLDDFLELQEVYKDVKITIVKGEPETTVKNGRLVIEQKETSHVNITDAQIKEIINLSESIRNKLIGL